MDRLHSFLNALQHWPQQQPGARLPICITPSQQQQQQLGPFLPPFRNYDALPLLLLRIAAAAAAAATPLLPS